MCVGRMWTKLHVDKGTCGHMRTKLLYTHLHLPACLLPPPPKMHTHPTPPPPNIHTPITPQMHTQHPPPTHTPITPPHIHTHTPNTPPPPPNRFNLTLGERLIEHLKNWLDPDTMLHSGPFAWKSGETKGEGGRRGGEGGRGELLAVFVEGGALCCAVLCWYCMTTWWW